MTREFEQQDNLLRFWLESRGIKLILWDLDDTILDTECVFSKKVNEYLDYIDSQLPQYQKDFLSKRLEEVNNEAYKTLAVSPNRWIKVAKDLSEVLSSEETIFISGLPILMEIYKTAPELNEGAIDALETFKSMNLPMGLVTHATEEWTKLKIKERDLYKYLDKIFIVSETKFKEANDWQIAIDSFSVKSEEVLVLGDNLAGDIRAVDLIGVKHKVYFPGEWSVYNSGNIPDGTIIIKDGIKALINRLVSEK